MKVLAPLAICLLLLVPAASRAMSVTPSPAGLIESFVAAWNSHNPVAFGHLVAADADWVTASGKRLLSRPHIQAFLADEHETWAKTTTMKTVSSRVRMLDDDTAVVMFEWEISAPAVAGQAPTVSSGNNLFVAVKRGDWIIVSGQVARNRAR